MKSGSPIIPDEKRSQEAIAEYVVKNMDDDYYVLGSGTTVKAIADKLGIKKTLLGVDVINKGKIVATDVNEKQLLKIIEGKKIKNNSFTDRRSKLHIWQMKSKISPKVIRKVGRDNIIV